ncbi:phospholipase D-like domain-containing protein [Luteimonas sp. SX5]|uniref:Phospholipase D-like domain-containing protein n=1 Tax=Luteimonas galliterrae TaxID=2940486 RepID=A0ABT0MIU1_9GAMM|nr:phospholipase D-like domain-containing protein [Luteimonas galliterrae]MCL1634802.1 phospholipase D-like domain-containing protein [Luteimonas galliterrae]
MKLIANGLNGDYLGNCMPGAEHEVGEVLAAIAYGSHSNNEKDDFISNCLRNGSRLDLWMRYDHTVPVTIPLLRRILRHHKDNIFCRLIPDCLHSKVIWWKGFGAYIGSANLSDRAWMTNIEAGLFLTEAELQGSGVALQLEEFFDGLTELKEAFPLSEEVIAELERIDKERRGVDDIGKASRTVPVWKGPQFLDSTKVVDRRMENFRKEWHETLTTLRSIGVSLRDFTPSWLRAGTPVNWEVDQFLHAYYYNQVGDRNSKPYQTYFLKNKANPKLATQAALSWWQQTAAAPSGEDENLYVKAEGIREMLARERIIGLSELEFARVCEYTHATTDHIAKMDLATLGRPEISYMPLQERIPLFADWLMRRKNRKGWGVLQLLEFVLYGGADSELWRRIYVAAKDREYVLPHYGLNSIAEVAGWARPELSPPRNGRTSKALKALGYDVRIY